MERLTKKDKRGKYYTVAQELGISDKQVNPITSWIEDCEERNFGNPINKLGRLEDLEEEIGCPLDLFVKLHSVNGLYCEITVALSSIPSWTDYLEIDRLGLDGIHFKKNKYELSFIEYNCYKNCFWLKKDKSE